MKRLLAPLCTAAALTLAACQPVGKDEAAPPASAPAAGATPAAGAAPTAAAHRTPTDLVQALYAREAIPLTEAEITGYFSSDLAAALMTDASSPETGAIDADYRYDAQDFQISELRLEPYADGPDESLVRAHFRNFGEPGQAEILLCRRPSGEWRIKDVRHARRGLREVLKLKPADEVTEC